MSGWFHKEPIFLFIAGVKSQGMVPFTSKQVGGRDIKDLVQVTVRHIQLFDPFEMCHAAEPFASQRLPSLLTSPIVSFCPIRFNHPLSNPSYSSHIDTVRCKVHTHRVCHFWCEDRAYHLFHA